MEKLETHRGISIFIYICLSLFTLVFMFYQSGFQSFWLDELSLIGTITKDKNVFDILGQYLTVDVTNLPLFPLAAALWYRIFPANDRLMLLLPQLAVAAAVYMAGKLSRLCFGGRTGVFAALLTSISSCVILRCGFEFRCYAFMLLFSETLLYTYIRRIRADFVRTKDSVILPFARFRIVKGKTRREDPPKTPRDEPVKVFALQKSELQYAAAMTLLIFTHYFGSIIAASLAFLDLIRVIISKGKKKRLLLPYGVSAIIFLPWFMLMLINKQKSLATFWPKKPTLPQIPRMMRALLSGNEAMFVLFIFALLVLLWHMLKIVLKVEKPSFSICCALTFAWSVIFVVGLVFTYSAILNPAGGIFLTRYFIVILPPMIGLISWIIVRIIDLAVLGKGGDYRQEFTFIAAVFILLYFGLVNFRVVREESGTSSETFREAASWIIENSGDELYESSSALVCSVNPRATAGFVEYYIRKGGRRSPVAQISLQGDNPVDEMKKYDTLYLVSVHRDMENLDSAITDYLEDNFVLSEANEDYRAFIYRRK